MLNRIFDEGVLPLKDAILLGLANQFRPIHARNPGSSFWRKCANPLTF
jgi:hypothetical protein